MANRRLHGEGGISFDHRGPCSDSQRHRHCPGRWRGEVTLGFTPEGKRDRRRVTGRTKTEVQDKLKALYADLDMGITRKAGDSAYTLRQAAEDWLRDGLDGRSAKTIKKNENVLAPILEAIGSKKLRELTAADVRQALTKMAARYSTAAVIDGPQRADSGDPARGVSGPGGRATLRRWSRRPRGRQDGQARA